MSRWAQFVALGLGPLAGLQSLRDIVGNLRAQPRKLPGVLSDQTIALTSVRSRKAYPGALRRVGCRDEETNRSWVS